MNPLHLLNTMINTVLSIRISLFLGLGCLLTKWMFFWVHLQPDAVVCSECGRGVVEVKCPYKHRDVTALESASLDKDFCLAANGTLKSTHNTHFSQKMLQFLSTEKGIVVFYCG